MTSQVIPRAFIWRRLHSLMGFWLVLFLINHLLANSQAALLLGDNARGFVNSVNAIHNLPYLPVIAIFLLGFPFAIHGVLGVKYLFTSKSNSGGSDGTKPAMKYGRNRAYTWQRLSSWVLLVGIILHVAQFRFIDFPDSINQGENSYFFIPVTVDKGLYTVAARLGVKLYSSDQVTAERKDFEDRYEEQTLVDASKTFEDSDVYDHQQQVILTSAQAYEQKLQWLQVLEKQKVNDHQVVAVAKDFGTASVLGVRDTFKSPLYVGLYTIFVLAACFHGFNGLWTFCITWGVVLKVAAQQRILRWAWALMILVTFLGLAAIWGTYWLNLKA